VAARRDGLRLCGEDDELEALEERFVVAARLARQAGFDAVDTKSCHRYLNAELLSGFTRPGRYGGSYENRTRFLRNVVRRVQEAVPGLAVVVRLGIYDGIPYPHGFGMAADGSLTPDLTEPKRLARKLAGMGVSLINVTLGNPYYNPHIGRPIDEPIAGAYTPDEHPLESVDRAFAVTRAIQAEVPETETRPGCQAGRGSSSCARSRYNAGMAQIEPRDDGQRRNPLDLGLASPAATAGAETRAATRSRQTRAIKRFIVITLPIGATRCSATQTPRRTEKLQGKSVGFTASTEEFVRYVNHLGSGGCIAMRIFISCDMEGITGMAIGKHCNPSEAVCPVKRQLGTSNLEKH